RGHRSGEAGVSESQDHTGVRRVVPARPESEGRAGARRREVEGRPVMKMKDGIYRRGAVYWVQYTARAPHRCVRPGPRAKHPCPADCPRRGRVELRVFRESAGGTRTEAKARLAEKRAAGARGSLVPDARRVTLEDLERLARDRYGADGRRREQPLAQAF